MSQRGTRKQPGIAGNEALPEVEPVGEAPAIPGERSVPSVDSVLAVLSGPRLLDLCRLLGCEVRDISGGRERLVRKLAYHMRDRLLAVLRELGRDELRLVCRRHGLDPSARARSDLQASILA